MLWSDRVNRLTGATMILLAACLVLGIAFSIGITDQEPTKRDEVQEFLLDVEDNTGFTVLSTVFFVLLDGVIGVAIAALLYITFRDRSRTLALLALAGLVVNSAGALVTDALLASMIPLADSYVNGGAGLEAGDPAFLDVAHVMMWVANLVTLGSFTALGVGLSALGVLFYAAPEGNANPPRIFGLAAILAGLTAFLTWAVVITDVGFLFFGLQGIFTLIFLVGVGWYLLMRPEEETPAPAAA